MQFIMLKFNWALVGSGIYKFFFSELYPERNHAGYFNMFEMNIPRSLSFTECRKNIW